MQEENVPMNLTNKQKQDFYNAKFGLVYAKPFMDPKNNKVWYHIHLTGEYWGAARYKCS